MGSSSSAGGGVGSGVGVWVGVAVGAGVSAGVAVVVSLPPHAVSPAISSMDNSNTYNFFIVKTILIFYL